jgi:anthranilate synthase/aminodeoxychorismate synthase-like glutamine amidotransferase
LKSKIFETSDRTLGPLAQQAEYASRAESGRARVVVVDNYDSFTYNLVQLIETLGADVEVVRNDAASAGALAARRASGVVLSPGPGTPDRAGVTLALVERCAMDAVPMLGVCLGHQAIGVAFGAQLRPARAPRHGKTIRVRHDGAGVFAGTPDPLAVALYHSLVIDELPDTLCATAWGPEGDLMGVRHCTLPLEGVQFHPESVLMPDGAHVVRNFLARCEALA